MESSLDKAYIGSARLALGFWKDSGTIPERFLYDSATISLRLRNPFGVKFA